MERAIDLWHDLCSKYSEPDGLTTWKEAGRWTRDKLYFWKRYIDITSNAMCGQRGRRAFPGGLVYVDLFGGAGVCALKGRSHERFPGSAIIAAHAPKPFERIIVCENNPSLAEACRATQCWLDERDGDTRYNATLFMPSCLECCRDVVHGGAESHLGQWGGMGLPNAANMVHAAVQLALESKDSLGDLFARIDAGDPALRARLRSLPTFGNDCDEVDGHGARLIALMADALERRATPLRTSLTLGHLAGGENMHIAYGLCMGATLDGRAAGQTLADSLTGSQGTATSGPTAQLRSTCRLDHSRLVGGNVSTLQLSPAEFATPAARAGVVNLIRTFVAMGGSQLQFNVSDALTLRQAQEDPEAYRGLFIRVAGYSADFTGIGRALQDEIIARTEGMA